MKKLLALILAILMLLPVIAACNNEEKPPVTTGDDVGDSGNDTTVPTPARMHNVPVDELDFGNEEINISAFTWQGYNYYFFAEEESSDPMESAIYQRRRAIEEAIAVSIKEVMYEPNYNTMYDALEQSIGTGDDSMQIVLTHCISRLSGYTSNGSLYPLEKLPHVDLDAEWWNQEQMNNLKLGKHYLLGANDYMLPCPYVIFFNKDMITDLNLESPYDLVDKNEWTLEKFEEIARAAARDVDNNNVYDENDVYGISCQVGGGSTFLSFWFASDQFMTYKNEDGYLKLFENTEKTMDICETIASWTKEHVTCPFPSGDDDDAIHMSTGQIMFWMSNIAGAEELRDTDVNYGIVPFPKYDENQKDYYSLDWGGFMVAPTTIQKPDMVGAVMELLAFESGKDGGVIDTYYDIVLDGQLAQDPIAPKMLDILFDTICYDPGVNFWGLSGSNMDLFYYPWKNCVLYGIDDFASFYASKKDSAQQRIDDYYTALEAAEALENLLD